MNITKWDAATWIAVAAAAIALFAAWASWRQAKAAKDQVKAAKDQVAIMRQQLGNEETDRHDAAGPKFKAVSGMRGTGGDHFVTDVRVTQVGGPKLVTVTVTVRPGGNVRGLIEKDGGEIVDSVTWADNAPGTVRELKVNLEPAEPCNVVLDFASVEPESGKRWTFTETTKPKTSRI